MSEKYGFVYIWHDRKHKRYYIGSHWIPVSAISQQIWDMKYRFKVSEASSRE